MYNMPSNFNDSRFLRSAICCIGMLLAGFGIANDDNASTLSELDLAKRDADDFAKLAKLVKPSVVVIESVDRVGREGGRGNRLRCRPELSLRPTFTSSANIETSPFALPTARLSAPKHLGRRPGTGSRLGQDRCKGFADPRAGDSNKIDPGQAIFSLGNPLGYSHSVSRGVVAAIRELEEGDGRPMVQVAIPIEPGSSGSPTLDLEGNVIAILAIKSGGAMGFGIPSNALKDLLTKQNPVPMKKWLTIGALDEFEWKSIRGGSWKQRAGVITATDWVRALGENALPLADARSRGSP